ncbi:MAG TPA: cyclase family protein [Clostridiales bacterium]|nr:cyclase family protein [Clostridiales bacterium]HQP69507.1 cyclase family protein [Clostridiales bacterium]
MKKIIDLTHTMNEKINVYPGSPKVSLRKADTHEKTGYAVLELKTITHNGTHIDAPYHMIKEGRTLDKFPISNFIGKAVCINCSKEKEITAGFINEFEKLILKADFVLFNSGWSKKWNKKSYLESYPVLTEEAAERLTKFRLKAIGLDYISIDPVTSTDMKLHKIILSKDICIIENLKGLYKLPAGLFDFYCIPLKIENADGSPVRAFAAI